MTSISGIITGAGKSSRMINDQLRKDIPIKNKLTLPLGSDGKTVLSTTIEHVLNSKVDECILVVGHDSSEIIESISNLFKDKIKIVKNKNINVSLSVSLVNGLRNSRAKNVLCVAGDQPSVTTDTYNNILVTLKKSKNPEKTISILRRRNWGLLETAEGLGMPFASNRKQLLNYLRKHNDNLNPILRKMFNEGFDFYGVKEYNESELLNVNNYSDYNTLFEMFK
jgi:molybdenum cofactor cytidylyltransferase